MTMPSVRPTAGDDDIALPFSVTVTITFTPSAKSSDEGGGKPTPQRHFQHAYGAAGR